MIALSNETQLFTCFYSLFCKRFCSSIHSSAVTCCHGNGRMGLQGQCHFFLFSSKLKAGKIFCDEMPSQYLFNMRSGFTFKEYLSICNTRQVK